MNKMKENLERSKKLLGNFAVTCFLLTILLKNGPLIYAINKTKVDLTAVIILSLLSATVLLFISAIIEKASGNAVEGIFLLLHPDYEEPKENNHTCDGTAAEKEE